MKNIVILACAALAAFPALASSGPALAPSSNTCEAPLLATSADVTTSDGASYQVETYYRSPYESAARFITASPALMVVEGPLVWTTNNDGAALAGVNERRFVIGHQFHALALHFDQLISDVAPVKNIAFKDGKYKGRKGAYPDGGDATLVLDKAKRPLGLLLELPDETRIEIAYEDWRDTPSGEAAPFMVTISHNGDLYTYRYTDISFATGDARAFQHAVPAPAIDEVLAYRTERAEAAAKCAETAAN